MNGPPIREHASELIVGHARPMADATDIKMHERRSRRRVVAHTSALQTQAGLPQLLQRCARDVEIHRLAERMLAELRHASAAPSQHRVGCWRTVSTNHMDGFVA